MRFQIRTLQVPARGAGAFAPTLTWAGAPATNGQNQIVGMPGTVPVAAPKPPALSDGELGGPYNQPSSVAPDFQLPSIYFARENRSLRFPGKLLSDHVLPVPAGGVTRTALQWHHRTRIGGRTATAAIRPFTTWPTYR